MNFKTHKTLLTLSKNLSKRPTFLSNDFLGVLVKYHQKNIAHYFITAQDKTSDSFIYAQKIRIGGRQIKSYNDKNNIQKRLASYFFSLFSFKIIGFGNNFLTNETSVFLNGKLEDSNKFLTRLIDFVSKKYCVSKLLFPDHFFKPLNINDPVKIIPQLIKIEVDEEMSLDIKPHWKTFDDYYNDLKKKYKKRMRNVHSKSQSILSRKLTKKDLIFYQKDLQRLFNQVRESSSFYSVLFSTDSFVGFKKIDNPKSVVYGYFLEEKLVAFSSEWQVQETLYSYFIGLEYRLNKKHSIYDRMLYQTIENGILLTAKKIIFGRTAAEFKSNFGAVPKKSYLYIYLKNPLLRFILRPILSRITPKKWIQRNPFK